MSGVNHIAGGTVFTGLFASLIFGINVLATPATLAIAVIASLLPDVDHTRSLIGKSVYPLAKWINRRWGHRTITHGMPCLSCLIILSGVIERTFFGHLEWTAIFGLAYFSHILLDMFTLQGVPIMFPFMRNPFVMIGNPEKRIRAGEHRKEALAFFVFVMAGLMMQPLFAKGFWTVWNQQLATLKHVHGEFLRSADVIQVEFEMQNGTETRRGHAYVIETKEAQAWCVDSSGRWVLLKEPECRRAVPTHTGKHLQITSTTFISVSADSVNRLLAGKTIQALDVQANQPFQITEPSLFPKTVTSHTADHISQAPAFAEIAQTTATETYIEDRSFQAEIADLERQIRHAQRDGEASDANWRQIQDKTAQLRAQYNATGDVTQRQRLQEELTELEAIKPPKPDSRIEELSARIQKIRQENQLRNDAKRQAVQLKNQQEQEKLQPTRFTGLVTYVSIQGVTATVSPASPQPQPQAQAKGYKIIGIKDGDSLEALDSNNQTFVIRLAHVDCPEYKQPFSAKAKEFTSSMVFGKHVQLQQTDTDRYGRRVCVVTIDGKTLNLELLRNGLAWHYKKYSQAKEYADAETAARAAAIGLWSEPSPTPPWDWRAANRN